MTPQQILSAKEHLDIIDRTSKKFFFDENGQQACFNYILDKLRENNFLVLKKHQSKKSKITTFITTCSNNFAIDFLRQKNGRLRFPKAISNLGEWAEKLYDLICWKQYSWEDAYEIFMIQKRFEGTFDMFLLKIKPITEVPCRYTKKTLYKSEIQQEWHPLPENPLETLLNHLDTQRRLTAARVIADITHTLSDEDQVLIKLVYGDDISVNQAAPLIGISPSTAHKRVKKSLLKFKEALLAEGIGHI